MVGTIRPVEVFELRVLLMAKRASLLALVLIKSHVKEAAILSLWENLCTAVRLDFQPSQRPHISLPVCSKKPPSLDRGKVCAEFAASDRSQAFAYSVT